MQVGSNWNKILCSRISLDLRWREEAEVSGERTMWIQWLKARGSVGCGNKGIISPWVEMCFCGEQAAVLGPMPVWLEADHTLEFQGMCSTEKEDISYGCWWRKSGMSLSFKLQETVPGWGLGKYVQKNPISPGFIKSWIHKPWNSPQWYFWRHESVLLSLWPVLAQGGSHQTNLIGGWRH